MNFKQLEYFILVAEKGNITAAANVLHIAQPPLSRQMALLEEEMGAVLFKRSNKGVELTEAGKILYHKAHEIFGTMSEMKELVQEADAGVRGEIRIGIIYSAITAISDKIKLLSQNYPALRFKIMHGDPNDLMVLLDNGGVDVLLLRSPTCETKDYAYHILEEDNLALVVHKDLDPAPNQAELKIEQLHGMPMVMLRSGNYWGYNEFLINECQKYGVTPNIICQCHDTSIALALVMQKVGNSYQPQNIVKLLQHSDIYLKPIAQFETKTFPTLIWNDNAYLPRSVRLFLSLFGIKSGWER